MPAIRNDSSSIRTVIGYQPASSHLKPRQPLNLGSFNVVIVIIIVQR